LFFAKQDDFGNFHAKVKSKKSKPKTGKTFGFLLLNFDFIETLKY